MFPLKPIQMDRLRSRDLKGSISKCYSIYYENHKDTLVGDNRKIPEVLENTSIDSAIRSSDKSANNNTFIVDTKPGNGSSESDEKVLNETVPIVGIDRLLKREDNNNLPENDERKRRLSAGADNEYNRQEFYKKIKYDASKELMFQNYQPWVIKTYGDLAKTKTITVKKHERIVNALEGLEQNNPDSSKFRFWVKSKGFTTDTPTNFKEVPAFEQNTGPSNNNGKSMTHLYVPNLTKEPGVQPYRKVAVVEQFFDIIYNVHVGLGGRSGRHAGQKRTYRTITESYAFLPRDAVTKFLAGCYICKKNSRPYSPSRLDDTCTESSSEPDALQIFSVKTELVDSPLSIPPKTSVSETASIESNPPENQDMNQTATDWEEAIKQESVHIVKEEKQEELTNSKKSDLGIIAGWPGTAVQSTYFEEIYSKINQYYSYQLNSSNDFKDLAASNELMNYYQLLRSFYEQSILLQGKNSNVDKQHQDALTPKKIEVIPKITVVKDEVKNIEDPLIDLTISKSPNSTLSTPKNSYQNNININIENGIDPKNANKPDVSVNPQSENNITINSAGVSINVSNSSKELKISCKTTPPKKRYSVYNHCESTETNKVNLSAKFNVETLVPECFVQKGQLNINAQNPMILRNQTSVAELKPLTSTYLQLMRSMGLTDDDALKFDNVEPITAPTATSEGSEPQHMEDAYAGLMKDADKLKLMLLAWNYQNSNAEGPDLGMVGGLWAQYQNALALNGTVKMPSTSPPRVETSLNSPTIENPDETSSSGQKDDDDGSEDDSDDRLDQNTHDPERLKAFNMFVRLFVDENLDRIIPISKQPKEKIQAIIDSCTRQFPEFSERARKRIRTYLKSCRRNKKTREGWDNTSRPTPAHLTSVQAEQLLAMACENESMNAKRMRIGLDPISQALPTAVNTTSESTASSISYPLGFKSTNETDAIQSSSIVTLAKTNLITSLTDSKPTIGSSLTNGNTGGLNETPLYRNDLNASAYTTTRAQQYQNYFSNAALTTNAPTDLSMNKQQQQQQQQQQHQQPSQPPTQHPAPLPQNQTPQSQPTQSRPPILSHKLNNSEITAVKQLVTGYRESAAFLLRSADELEQLLLNQHQ